MPREPAGTGGANGANAGAEESTLWSRLAWFAGLWLAGVASLGAIAMVIRWAIQS